MESRLTKHNPDLATLAIEDLLDDGMIGATLGDARSY